MNIGYCADYTQVKHLLSLENTITSYLVRAQEYRDIRYIGEKLLSIMINLVVMRNHTPRCSRILKRLVRRHKSITEFL